MDGWLPRLVACEYARPNTRGVELEYAVTERASLSLNFLLCSLWCVLKASRPQTLYALLDYGRLDRLRLVPHIFLQTMPLRVPHASLRAARVRLLTLVLT